MQWAGSSVLIKCDNQAVVSVLASLSACSLMVLGFLKCPITCQPLKQS